MDVIFQLAPGESIRQMTKVYLFGSLTTVTAIFINYLFLREVMNPHTRLFHYPDFPYNLIPAPFAPRNEACDKLINESTVLDQQYQQWVPTITMESIVNEMKLINQNYDLNQDSNSSSSSHPFTPQSFEIINELVDIVATGKEPNEDKVNELKQQYMDIVKQVFSIETSKNSPETISQHKNSLLQMTETLGDVLDDDNQAEIPGNNLGLRQFSQAMVFPPTTSTKTSPSLSLVNILPSHFTSKTRSQLYFYSENVLKTLDLLNTNEVCHDNKMVVTPGLGFWFPFLQKYLDVRAKKFHFDIYTVIDREWAKEFHKMNNHHSGYDNLNNVDVISASSLSGSPSQCLRPSSHYKPHRLVTFNTDGGMKIDEQDVDVLCKIKQHNQPTKEITNNHYTLPLQVTITQPYPSQLNYPHYDNIAQDKELYFKPEHRFNNDDDDEDDDEERIKNQNNKQQNRLTFTPYEVIRPSFTHHDLNRYNVIANLTIADIVALLTLIARTLITIILVPLRMLTIFFYFPLNILTLPEQQQFVIGQAWLESRLHTVETFVSEHIIFVFWSIIACTFLPQLPFTDIIGFVNGEWLLYRAIVCSFIASIIGLIISNYFLGTLIFNHALGEPEGQPATYYTSEATKDDRLCVVTIPTARSIDAFQVYFKQMERLALHINHINSRYHGQYTDNIASSLLLKQALQRIYLARRRGLKKGPAEVSGEDNNSQEQPLEKQQPSFPLLIAYQPRDNTHGEEFKQADQLSPRDKLQLHLEQHNIIFFGQDEEELDLWLNNTMKNTNQIEKDSLQIEVLNPHNIDQFLTLVPLFYSTNLNLIPDRILGQLVSNINPIEKVINVHALLSISDYPALMSRYKEVTNRHRVPIKRAPNTSYPPSDDSIIMSTIVGTTITDPVPKLTTLHLSQEVDVAEHQLIHGAPCLFTNLVEFLSGIYYRTQLLLLWQVQTHSANHPMLNEFHKMRLLQYRDEKCRKMALNLSILHAIMCEYDQYVQHKIDNNIDNDDSDQILINYSTITLQYPQLGTFITKLRPKYHLAIQYEYKVLENLLNINMETIFSTDPVPIGFSQRPYNLRTNPPKLPKSEPGLEYGTNSNPFSFQEWANQCSFVMGYPVIPPIQEIWSPLPIMTALAPNIQMYLEEIANENEYFANKAGEIRKQHNRMSGGVIKKEDDDDDDNNNNNNNNNDEQQLINIPISDIKLPLEQFPPTVRPPFPHDYLGPESGLLKHKMFQPNPNYKDASTTPKQNQGQSANSKYPYLNHSNPTIPKYIQYSPSSHPGVYGYLLNELSTPFEQQSECAICLMPFTDSTPAHPHDCPCGTQHNLYPDQPSHTDTAQRLAILPCNHRFHFGCLGKWLESRSACPIDAKHIGCSIPIHADGFLRFIYSAVTLTLFFNRFFHHYRPRDLFIPRQINDIISDIKGVIDDNIVKNNLITDLHLLTNTFSPITASQPAKIYLNQPPPTFSKNAYLTTMLSLRVFPKMAHMARFQVEYRRYLKNKEDGDKNIISYNNLFTNEEETIKPTRQFITSIETPIEPLFLSSALMQMSGQLYNHLNNNLFFYSPQALQQHSFIHNLQKDEKLKRPRINTQLGSDLYSPFTNLLNEMLSYGIYNDALNNTISDASGNTNEGDDNHHVQETHIHQIPQSSHQNNSIPFTNTNLYSSSQLQSFKLQLHQNLSHHTINNQLLIHNQQKMSGLKEILYEVITKPRFNHVYGFLSRKKTTQNELLSAQQDPFDQDKSFSIADDYYNTDEYDIGLLSPETRESKKFSHLIEMDESYQNNASFVSDDNTNNNKNNDEYCYKSAISRDIVNLPYNQRSLIKKLSINTAALYRDAIVPELIAAQDGIFQSISGQNDDLEKRSQKLAKTLIDKIKAAQEKANESTSDSDDDEDEETQVKQNQDENVKGDDNDDDDDDEEEKIQQLESALTTTSTQTFKAFNPTQILLTKFKDYDDGTIHHDFEDEHDGDGDEICFNEDCFYDMLKKDMLYNGIHLFLTSFPTNTQQKLMDTGLHPDLDENTTPLQSTTMMLLDGVSPITIQPQTTTQSQLQQQDQKID